MTNDCIKLLEYPAAEITLPCFFQGFSSFVPEHGGERYNVCASNAGMIIVDETARRRRRGWRPPAVFPGPGGDLPFAADIRRGR